MVRIYDMKQKEVVNIRDGCRLGFICDIEVDLTDGMIISITAYGWNASRNAASNLRFTITGKEASTRFCPGITWIMESKRSS